MNEFNPDTSHLNTAPAIDGGIDRSQTTETQKWFDGPIYPVRLVTGIYGPFYRVAKDLGDDDNLAEKYRKDALRSRASRIQSLTELSSAPEKFRDYIKEHFEDIEMDPNFTRLDDALNFFPSTHHECVRKIYKKVAEGRWLGLTKPVNFQDAHCMYHLPHLIGKSPRFLYEIFIEVPSKPPSEIPNFEPIIRCGKATNGTSLQFKLTNHATLCVSDVKKLGPI